MTRLKPGTSSQTETFRRDNRTAFPTIPIRSKHPNDAPEGHGEANISLNQNPVLAKNTEETYHHESHEPQVIHDEGDTGSGPRWHHMYIDITANSNARQINGNILTENTVLAPRENFYGGIVATEDSQQINGNVNDRETLKAFFS